MDIAATISAIRKKLVGDQQPDQDVQAPEAEALSKKLPAQVMPREAIEKKRARLKKLDQETKED